MQINVAELPDVARQPFQLAQRFQVAALMAQGSPRVLKDQALADQYKAHMARAQEDNVIPNAPIWPGNSPGEILFAARQLWAVGLLQLQRLIAAGEWFPPTLDPLVFPDADKMLDARHARALLG